MLMWILVGVGCGYVTLNIIVLVFYLICKKRSTTKVESNSKNVNNGTINTGTTKNNQSAN